MLDQIRSESPKTLECRRGYPCKSMRNQCLVDRLVDPRLEFILL